MLKSFFDEHPECAVAFSGGADSAYLLYEAKLYARRFAAFYVKTAFQPMFEFEDALRFTREHDIPLRVLLCDALSCEEIVSNPPDRCYHCKRRIFGAIAEAARKAGFDTVLDGTNASDDAGDRPGMRALEELRVLSPLRLAGLEKARVRELSREAGLFTWDKPAYACLATRIGTGRRIERRLLERTERAEAYLASLGFTDFRIRTLGETGLLQVTEDDMPLARERFGEIRERLCGPYADLLLDPEARHGQ